MRRFVRKGFGTRDVLVVHIVLSLAGRIREPVGSFFWRPKTKDCAAHSKEPPVLLLILQENQETWPRTRGDFAAAAHLSHRRLAVIWLQTTARTASGASFPGDHRRVCAYRRAWPGRSTRRLQYGVRYRPFQPNHSTPAPTRADSAEPTRTPNRIGASRSDSPKASVPMKRLIVKPMPVRMLVP